MSMTIIIKNFHPQLSQVIFLTRESLLMQKFKKFTFTSLMLVSLTASAATNYKVEAHHTEAAASNQNSAELNIEATATRLEEAAPTLNHRVVTLALEAYYKAREKGYDKRGILSVIDFSLPSYEKSLWVFNVNDGKLLYNTYVAHGKGSGDTTATHFSNRPGSEASSLGVFLTGQTYYGRDGLAMRLIGLSGKFNDNVLSRAVVMHGAWYVSQSFLDENHRLGRSWGCPAVSKGMIGPITNTIKDGTLIFAYANDPAWLPASTYVA